VICELASWNFGEKKLGKVNLKSIALVNFKVGIFMAYAYVLYKGY
jgi:hypothetical protein